VQPRIKLETQVENLGHLEPVHPVPTVPSSVGAHSDDSPALVRTSQLGQDAKPEQASIAIQGDLDTMKRGWYTSFPSCYYLLLTFADVGLRVNPVLDVGLSSSGSGK
jgi:hypothetical protein